MAGGGDASSSASAASAPALGSMRLLLKLAEDLRCCMSEAALRADFAADVAVALGIPAVRVTVVSFARPATRNGAGWITFDVASAAGDVAASTAGVGELGLLLLSHVIDLAQGVGPLSRGLVTSQLDHRHGLLRYVGEDIVPLELPPPTAPASVAEGGPPPPPTTARLSPQLPPPPPPPPPPLPPPLLWEQSAAARSGTPTFVLQAPRGNSQSPSTLGRQAPPPLAEGSSNPSAVTTSAGSPTPPTPAPSPAPLLPLRLPPRLPPRPSASALPWSPASRSKRRAASLASSVRTPPWAPSWPPSERGWGTQAGRGSVAGGDAGVAEATADAQTPSSTASASSADARAADDETASPRGALHSGAAGVAALSFRLSQRGWRRQLAAGVGGGSVGGGAGAGLAPTASFLSLDATRVRAAVREALPRGVAYRLELHLDSATRQVEVTLEVGGAKGGGGEAQGSSSPPDEAADRPAAALVATLEEAVRAEAFMDALEARLGARLSFSAPPSVRGTRGDLRRAAIPGDAQRSTIPVREGTSWSRLRAEHFTFGSWRHAGPHLAGGGGGAAPVTWLSSTLVAIGEDAPP